MSPAAIGIVGLAVMFLMMAGGVHIAVCLGLVAFVGYIFIDGIENAMTMVACVPYSFVANYLLSPLVLFLLMGEFASVSGLMRDAYRCLNKWVGSLPGGLAMATTGGCASFAAVCGDSIASAVTMTRVCLPEMLEYNYDPKLATGTIAAGGTMGILIPPSIGFIIYGMIAEQSIGRLFMAGVIPGFLEAIFYIITIYILCKRNPLMGPPGPKFSWRERLAALKDIWGIAFLFVLVMGGIWGGIFTPTEAAAMGVLFAFLLVLGRRELTWQSLIVSFKAVISTGGMILALIICAMIFCQFMAVSGLPAKFALFISGLPIPPTGVLVVILLVYIVLGCVMSPITAILITFPILLPLLTELGIDLIWYGVLMVRIIEIAAITPPVGMNVFVISGVVKDRGISMATVFRGIIPFVIADFCHVALLLAVPQLSLFLPSTMMPLK